MERRYVQIKQRSKKPVGTDRLPSLLVRLTSFWGSALICTTKKVVFIAEGLHPFKLVLLLLLVDHHQVYVFLF